ncbi:MULTISPECIES: type I methionyl aminopeptidase [unclassified Arthrobacter]|uniref:type I methionyl aminopeptidase n=1 Tax=unclassified Arthrobacter TaxID=235627 RepID=UPI001D137E64|nr:MULTISPECIES: type I methionyl aminopeptidase [unclassified Arthrobacter]MCC3290290.1 type I methionyl aminopeptidase [Arthrobacter sp. zg-Y1110]MCC3300199.1 type I methionyl aminopeptidase [Arthrobacter sp. zg-Y895]MCQ1945582.1 type I methionyl aminopeptidase [Arthrobacter sp. zg-Y1116]MCQ1985524.1 type I methionyl aminopeptidase [Arthrobacter sp. zg-Y844]MCQ1994759.1 type I methionyl aminopeptidase [Arthrobacter sp. zg-Y1171]
MFGQPRIEYKTNEQMRIMREAGLVLISALDAAVKAADVGVSTREIDAVFARVLKEAGATSNFLGYYDYPATVCTSVNEEVVHGIPGDRVLQDGDIISIDGGAVVNGWHSDSARTVIVGTPDPEDQRLSDVTENAMWHGIAAAAKGKFVGDIGDAVDDYVSSVPGKKLGILEDYVGHGIGTEMHQAPDVLNYRTGHRGPKLRPGLCLAIEPMLVRGKILTRTLDDDWTVVTEDGSRSSQWEHSVAIHEKGIWVLTAPDGGASRLEPLGVTPVPIP